MKHSSASAPPQDSTIDALLDRYDGILFDAFGVLVQGEGALPGAQALVEFMNQRQYPYAVVTNDSTRSIQTCVARFERLGMSIPGERIITSGSLIEREVDRAGLRGARALVLGPPDTKAYAQSAGLELVDERALMHDQGTIEVFIAGDFPSSDTLLKMEAAVSALIRTIDQGITPTLLLPNPDLIYPKQPGHIGLTAGSLAKLVQHVLKERYPNRAEALYFQGLGKPYPMIYEAGLEIIGCPKARALMIGDQIATDIQGAHHLGMDSALVTTGLIQDPSAWPIQPTYLLHDMVQGKGDGNV